MSYRLVGFSEIQEASIMSYSVLNNISSDLNLGPVETINPKAIEDYDMQVWGFPCTQISWAGNQEGFYSDENELTSSGLFYYGLNILKIKRPAISIIENVENLLSKQFSGLYQHILGSLEAAGYNNYVKLLNAYDFGIPQNRRRVFIVSIRQDVDKGGFVFSRSKKHSKLCDYIKSSAPEKYYADASVLNSFFSKYGFDRTSVSNRIENLDFNEFKPPSRLKLKKYEVLLLQAFLNNNGVYGKYVDVFNKRVLKGLYASTLNTMSGTLTGKGSMAILEKNDLTSEISLRVLTPEEAWSLMGFSKTDIQKVRSLNLSDSTLYKQAGNSIVLQVLESIYAQLYIEFPALFENMKVLTLFSGIGAAEKALTKFYEGDNNE